MGVSWVLCSGIQTWLEHSLSIAMFDYQRIGGLKVIRQAGNHVLTSSFILVETMWICQ